LRDVPNVLANELKLSQVVVNLLTNAVQALTGEREDNEIRVATWTDETGGAVIEVEDNGRGMSEEVRLAVFEPFFTTKLAGHGTGLGLSICRSIVVGLGGQIFVESAPGRGSRFRVSLPASTEPLSASDDVPAVTPLPARSSARPPGDAPRVLIIDDEPMILGALRRALGGEYRVTCVFTSRAPTACAPRWRR